MTPLGSMGKMLIVMGVLLVIVGALMLAGARLPRLPGDIVIERPGVRVYIPIVTMILVSIVLTLLLNILARR
jgi:uncharacterized membrane protein